MSLPTITAMGQLVVAPRVRTTPRGDRICRVRLACKGASRTTHLNVDLAGPHAPQVAASLAAGDYAHATGHLVHWTSRDGHLVYALEADELRWVDALAVAR
ncbi:single-stranded DNA-binding protein [Cellulomonas sp. P5_C5]